MLGWYELARARRHLTLLVLSVTVCCVVRHVTVVDGFHPSVLSLVVPKKDSGIHPSRDSRHHGGVFRAASTDSTSTALFMGKLRNKQADLQKKMMLAKKQKEEQEQSNNGGDQSTTASSSSSQQSQVRLSDMEMKEQNDRKRFEELLASSAVSMSDVSSDYLTEEQELENIDAYRKGVDRLYEGDLAKAEAFEELVSIKSENAIGKTGAKRLLPWLRNSGNSECLVVVCDPRVKSPEFRDTVTLLHRELPTDLLSKVVFINADTPAENRRWLKKSGMMDSITLYSDEKMEWMRTYSALGETRWSMTLFVLADERIQKLVREMASVTAASVVQNAVKVAERRLL